MRKIRFSLALGWGSMPEEGGSPMVDGPSNLPSILDLPAGGEADRRGKGY